ncbi:membrane protein [Thauera linaloolentis 47Lol = DSM 12138]|uniref:Membrane protein n=1 Tax=Thauera linaloolentis (strain DSM 12138 / JCM 21573 / CCUG 41526 / CIP 105981 / IAM 15112 / NBRC 102519 / 47Lol) TaxID=1123367 RepID=N6YNI9_THAL4|nr:membrane protein [Thauera linaloolentis 47Lol = DSM 12138]
MPPAAEPGPAPTPPAALPPPSPPAPPPLHGWRRVLLQCLAVISLGVAGVGVVVPGLPTTEFVLLAAWAAARSSPRLHGWIVRHRLFGPLLAHWQAGRLPRRAKWAATATMGLAATVAALTVPHRVGVALLAACMAGVLVWLWRRPEP